MSNKCSLQMCGLALIVLSLATVFVSPARSQSVSGQDINQQLQWYKTRAEFLIGEFRPQIRSGLSSQQQEIERRVQYRVVVTGNANAQARVSGSIGYTDISAGLVQVIDWLSHALAISAEFGKRACTMGYVKYLADGIEGNSSAVASHQPLQPVGSPFVFARLRPDLCPGVTEARFRARQRAVEIRELFVAGSLKLIMAHELAHHVYGHTLSRPVNLKASRERERAADEFSFRALSLSGTIPYEGFPVILLFSAVEGFSIEGETASDHPSGLHRLRDMAAFSADAVESDEAVKNALINSGKMEQWRQMVAGLKEEIDELDRKR